MAQFTERQLADFKAYEEVRQSGQINMWDALNGSRLSGLTRDEYMFVMKNYGELKQEVDGDETKARG
jgi:hypothetical protein